MKKLNRMLMLTALVAISMGYAGCSKKEGCNDVNAINYDSEAEKDDGSCEYKGKVTFWNDVLSKLCPVVVIMSDGTSGNITLNYTSSPDCDASGCFTFLATPGTYTYNAQESDCDGDGKYGTWSGSVTITSEGCKKLRLY